MDSLGEGLRGDFVLGVKGVSVVVSYERWVRDADPARLPHPSNRITFISNYDGWITYNKTGYYYAKLPIRSRMKMNKNIHIYT